MLVHLGNYTGQCTARRKEKVFGGGDGGGDLSKAHRSAVVCLQTYAVVD